MGISTFKRSIAAGGVFGIAGMSLFGASGAMAADFECDVVEGLPTPTVLDSGICEIVITSADGVTEVTLPSELGQVAALVVGAGGGGFADTNYDYAAYGGGGGQVQYIDDVALDVPLAVEIGEGGEGRSDGSVPGDGGNTTFGDVVALGGKAAYPYSSIGGHSWMFDVPADEAEVDSTHWTRADGKEFYPNPEFVYYLGGGAGTAGDAVETQPGPGVLPSEIGGGDLFPAAEDNAEYGRGGEGFVVAHDVPVLTIDEAALISVEAATIIEPEDAPSVAPNSGQGGNASLDWADYGMDGDYRYGYIDGADALDGADGTIVLRYSAATLAETGVDATTALAAGGVAALAGAGLVAVASRRRQTV